MTQLSRRAWPDWYFSSLALYTGLLLVWLLLIVFDFVTHPLAPDPISGTVAFRWLLMLVVMPAALVVAVLVLRRTPGNITGLCLLLGVVLIGGLTLRPNSPLLPYNLKLNTAWVGVWLLGLHFPDGQPQPARAAGLIRWLSVLFVLSSATLGFFDPTVTLGRNMPALSNPVFVKALQPLQAVATGLQSGLVVILALLIVPSLVWRYRMSAIRGRLQLKWLASAFALMLVVTLPLMVAALAAGMTDPFAGLGRWPLVGVTLYLIVFPYVAVGNAILRHRLYDIDVIIRRTLVYSVLTALLTLTYFGTVLVLESISRVFMGQTQNSLVVVLSTLIIAALFVPLRRRVQRVIDRRFYRQKYDAVRTLAGFAAGARDETDLEQLSTRLIGVVDETMQPESVTLWLKGR